MPVLDPVVYIPLTNLVIGIAIALLSSWFTVRFTLKRFYTEKWWERKVEAYGGIMESLHAMKNYGRLHMEYMHRGSEPSESIDASLVEESSLALSEIRKRADMGCFFISEEAIRALVTLEKDIKSAADIPSWDAHIILEYEAIEKCLVAIREIAKKEIERP